MIEEQMEKQLDDDRYVLEPMMNLINLSTLDLNRKSKSMEGKMVSFSSQPFFS